MKSTEGFIPTKSEIEKAEQEITPKSPEFEVAEVNNEDLEQHTISAVSYIEQQTADILSEGEKRLESSSSSMKVSPETLDNAKQEFGLDAKLQEVKDEADQIADEAQSDIASVMEKPQPEKITEIKEQTPKEIKEERRMGIVKEIEKEWEAKNGPMERQMTKAEIEGTKSWEIFNRRKWDGGTMRMTDAASEFFFDHSGMGKFSVPKQAEKILAERFPEYAQKTEQPPQDKQIETIKKVSADETIKPKNEAEKTFTNKFTEDLKQAGIEFDAIKIENNGEFPEAIILKKQEIPAEKMIRIYRRLNDLDTSVLKQIPYAMRSENHDGRPTILEDVKNEVEALAKNPTYENLLSYMNKVRQDLSQDEIHRMDEDFVKIENEILDGHSTKRELMHQQTLHNGGWADSGISPYISASINPLEATGYGDEALLVIDLPSSEVEYMGGEVYIKGALDKKFITAILSRKRGRGEAKNDEEKINSQIQRALQKVNKFVEIPLYNNKEMHSLHEKNWAKEKDNEQQKKDVEKIRLKRVEKLAETFPAMKINLKEEQEKSAAQGIDIYTKVKRDIYDHYKTRLEKIGRNGMDINDYDFSESKYSEQKKFNREKISDIMLIELRKLVQIFEEREEEREYERKKRKQ